MGEVHDYSSENLRELRKNADFSRREILEKLENLGVKMHPTTLRRIEDGEQNMKVHEARAVAEIFGMTLNDLVDAPVNADEAEIRTRMFLLKTHEDSMMFTRHSWLLAWDDLTEHLGQGKVRPNQSKVTRDAQQYLEDAAPFRAWLLSTDFPEDRNTGADEFSKWYGTR